MDDLQELPMQITLKQCHCQRCENKWYPKPGRGKPKVCPKCKSYDWDKPRPDRKVAKHAA